MTPKKKGRKTVLSATVDAPQIAGEQPSFVENPQSVVDSNVMSTSTSESKEKPGESVAFSVEPTESEEKIETRADDKLEVDVAGTTESKETSKTSADASTELVVEAPIIESKPRFVAKSDEGEESGIRALSQISPTFSTQGSDESEYKMAPESLDASEEETNDGDESSEVEINDYEQWGDFFAQNRDAQDSNSESDDKQDDDSFGSYLVSESEDDSEDENDDEEIEDDADDDEDFEEEFDELEDE